MILKQISLVTHLVEKQFTPEEELLSASSGMRRYEPRLIAESLLKNKPKVEDVRRDLNRKKKVSNDEVDMFPNSKIGTRIA